MICFQRNTRCQKVTIRPKRYCVRWVWSIRRFMLARMIAYCTDLNFKKCPNALGVGYHGTKWRMMTNVVVTKTQRRPPQGRCCGVPIISRFKRLFANVDAAKDLTCHADGKNFDGMLRHLADSSQWKNINRLYPDFDKKARNLQHGLATNGMNPYGSFST